MGKAANVLSNLKTWFKSRPKWDVYESATWFLLLFAYAYGLTEDGFSFDFKWSGIVPVVAVSTPQVNLIMVSVCLGVSVVLLIEPLLSDKCRKWTSCARQSIIWRYIYRSSVLLAFIIGLSAGLNDLIEKLPTLTWLIGSVSYVGIFIFLALLIKLVLTPLSENKSS